MKSDFMNLYEELNKLNESKLVEKKASTIPYVFAIFEDCYRDAWDLHGVGTDTEDAFEKFEELKEWSEEYRGPNYPLYLMEYSEACENALTEDQFEELESLINKATSDSDTIEGYFRLGSEIDFYEADEPDYDEDNEYDYEDDDTDLDEEANTELKEAAADSGGLEEVIDIMEKYNRLPYLPSRWKIDDIDDSSDVSSISFINKGLQLMFWFYVKEEKDTYTISYNAGMSDIDFSHKAHIMSNLSPEDCIKFIFGAVEEFDNILDYARNNDIPGYKKALKAAGYKVSRV